MKNLSKGDPRYIIFDALEMRKALLRSSVNMLIMLASVAVRRKLRAAVRTRSDTAEDI